MNRIKWEWRFRTNKDQEMTNDVDELFERTKTDILELEECEIHLRPLVSNNRRQTNEQTPLTTVNTY